MFVSYVHDEYSIIIIIYYLIQQKIEYKNNSFWIHNLCSYTSLFTIMPCTMQGCPDVVDRPFAMCWQA